MKLLRLTFALLLVVMVTQSCKNDTKNADSTATTITEEVKDSIKVETEKAQEKQRQKAVANSVMGKLMVTAETKTYMSHVISCGILDLYKDEEQPITVFAPSNDAFLALTESTRLGLSDPMNKATITTIMQNHVVKGNLSSADLLQAVKKDKNHVLQTVGGASLTVYLEGNELMIKDGNGISTSFGKTDILAANGKVHIVNALLTITK